MTDFDFIEDFFAFEMCSEEERPSCETCGSPMVEDGEGRVCLECESR